MLHLPHISAAHAGNGCIMTTKPKAYKHDYLFLRPGSQNWHIRLQYPGKRIEKSLGTPDRREAAIIAAPMIDEHRLKLLALRPHIWRQWVTVMEPGREHVAEDG